MTTEITTYPVLQFRPVTVINNNNDVVLMRFVSSQKVKIDNVLSSTSHYDMKMKQKVQETLNKFPERTVDVIITSIPQVIGQQATGAASTVKLLDDTFLIYKGEVLEALIASLHDHRFAFEAKVSCFKSGLSCVIKKDVTIDHPVTLAPAIAQTLGVKQGNNITTQIQNVIFSVPNANQLSMMVVTGAKITISAPLKPKKEGFELYAVFNKMLADKTFCDFRITIEGEGTWINVHKCILIAQSEEFRKMLTVGDKPSAVAFKGILELNDMTGKGLRAFVDYLYTRSLETSKTDLTTAFELLNAGHKYGIAYLKEDAANVIINWAGKIEKEGEVELWLKIYKFASSLSDQDDMMDDLKIRSAMNLHKIQTYFQESETWKQLFREEPQFAAKLMFFMMEKAKVFGNAC